MTPLVLKTNDLNAVHLAFLEETRAFVRSLEDGLDCHEVCRRLLLLGSVGRYFRGVRGWFGIYGVEHSWLEASRGERVILDPYPVACGSGPILVYADGHLNPWGRVYMTEKPAAGET